MKTNNKIVLWLTIGLVLLSTLACSINLPDINLETVDTEEMKSYPVNIPDPNIDGVTLNLRIAAGDVEIQGGSDQWVDGTIETNVPDWEPKVEVDGTNVTIRQQADVSEFIPAQGAENDWNLRLGKDVPMALVIDAGAYDGTIDLSGVPLTALTISDGASKNRVVFNEMNPVEMSKLSYRTGASDVRLTGLANANFAEMSMTVGAGNYVLDFSGDLKRDITVNVSGGVSNTRIVIPDGRRAIIHVGGALNNVDTSGTWTSRDDTYETSGSGPTITIEVEIAAGNLELEQD